MVSLNKHKIPNHVAITMDGNGRWAKRKGRYRVFGHQNGVKAVRESVEYAVELGIKYLTLYAFSIENWNRPTKEITALMTLLVSTINKERKTLMENKVSLNVIGDTDKLPDNCKKQLNQAIEETAGNQRMKLILALSYGGRWDIINAVNKILKEKKESVSENVFKQYLATKNVPDPELLIRTSGEYRISNFLLWQIAYSELYFTDTLWPDFRKADFEKAILDYQNRERRFGKTTDQVKDFI
jgi:undecaprenyl diphosphate synthase